jgi:hypothetical protein
VEPAPLIVAEPPLLLLAELELLEAAGELEVELLLLELPHAEIPRASVPDIASAARLRLFLTSVAPFRWFRRGSVASSGREVVIHL